MFSYVAFEKAQKAQKSRFLDITKKYISGLSNLTMVIFSEKH